MLFNVTSTVLHEFLASDDTRNTIAALSKERAAQSPWDLSHFTSDAYVKQKGIVLKILDDGSIYLLDAEGTEPFFSAVGVIVKCHTAPQDGHALLRKPDRLTTEIMISANSGNITFSTSHNNIKVFLDMMNHERPKDTVRYFRETDFLSFKASASLLSTPQQKSFSLPSIPIPPYLPCAMTLTALVKDTSRFKFTEDNLVNISTVHQALDQKDPQKYHIEGDHSKLYKGQLVEITFALRGVPMTDLQSDGTRATKHDKFELVLHLESVTIFGNRLEKDLDALMKRKYEMTEPSQDSNPPRRRPRSIADQISCNNISRQLASDLGI